jgi:hypothetical protein
MAHDGGGQLGGPERIRIEGLGHRLLVGDLYGPPEDDGVGVGVGLGVTLPFENENQLKLPSYPLGSFISKTSLRTCWPAERATGCVTVVKVRLPPVPGTVRDPEMFAPSISKW